MEALGDVDGGIVKAHGLARAHVAGAPAAGVGEHRLDDAARQALAAQEHVQIAAHDLHMVDLPAAELLRQRGGDHLRGLAQRFGQAEARQREVAQLLLRRNLQHGRQLVAGHAAAVEAARLRLRDALGDSFLHIHSRLSLLIPAAARRRVPAPQKIKRRRRLCRPRINDCSLL